MRHLYYTLQTFRRGRSSSFITVVSLAAGLLMSVFLFARIAFELSYDSCFREADKLYLIKNTWIIDGKPGPEAEVVLHAVPGTIAELYPDRVTGATVMPAVSLTNDYRIGERQVKLGTLMGDTLFFSVMGLDVLRGNPQELGNPDVLFLSESGARRLFGDEDPIGQTVTYDFIWSDVTLTVKGIFRDVPLNNSLPLYERGLEAVVSFPSIWKHTQWSQGWNSGGNYMGYVRLRSKEDAAWLNERLTAALSRYIPADAGLDISARLVPVRDLHISQPDVRRRVAIMSLLGVVLLLVTALNYVLASVSSLTRRAKTVAVHKCSGADMGNIFCQFLLETAGVVLAALLLATGCVVLLPGLMEEMAGMPLAELFAWNNLYAPLAAVAVLFLLGGCLPAVLFARIPVTQVFRRYTSGRRGWKRVLLVVQFAGAAFILGMMLVVAMQYVHMVSRDRGWNPERVAFVWNRDLDGDQLLTQLRHLPYVEAVASSNQTMLGFGSNRGITDAQGNAMFTPRNTWFDADYLPLIGLKLKEGHNLTGDRQLLVNLPFCRKMGWTDSPIGKPVNDYGTVVGLLDSFAFPGSPDDDVPVMIEWQEGVGSTLSVRLKAPFDDNLRRLNEDMGRIYPQTELVFKSMTTMMLKYAEPVRIFRNVTLMASITILFIILLGVTSYVNDEIRLRSKEIAIRKVNGAETTDILWLLSREVWWMAFLSVLLGMAGAYLAGQVWCRQFQDVVPIGGMSYVLLAVGLLLLILCLVCVKAWHIANENPVESIKSE